MNLRPRRLDQPEINLTPLIDVVFLLLIFFMVSTTFREETALQLQLPEIAEPGTRSPEPAQWMLLEIDAEGGYFVEGERLEANSAEALTLALENALETNQSWSNSAAPGGSSTKDASPPPLVIRADRDSAHGDLMRALDVAGQLGLRQVRFAAISNPSPSSAIPRAGESLPNPDSTGRINQDNTHPEDAAANNDGREGSQ